MYTDLIQGSGKNAMKEISASSSDLWKVPPHEINLLDGYNIRIRNEAYNRRVREIADSIKVNGFLSDQPLSVYARKTETGANELVLIGGHRRLEAVKIAIAEGCEIPVVPVIVKPFGTSVEDLLVDLKVGNDGEPISTLEQALLCQRFIKFGWEPQQIAERLGYQPTQVSNLLTLAAAPAAVRNHVANDRISATLAIQLLLKHGTKAPGIIERLVTGKTTKVTPKDVPAIRFKQYLRKQAEPMYRAIQSVQADPGWASLSKETQALLEETMRAPK